MTDDKATIAMLRNLLVEAEEGHGIECDVNNNTSQNMSGCNCGWAERRTAALTATEAESAAFVERVRTEARAAALEEAAKTFDTLPEYLEKWKEVARRLRALAQVHPPGQAFDNRGDSASTQDPIAASAAPTCATCGGACFVRTSMYPGSLAKCPDCARGGT